MSGHSKWSTIKHKKGVADAKRGKLFSKLSREILIAARHGANADANVALRVAVERARSMNMPHENIERAVRRGSAISREQLEELFMEAYGPGGAALLIKIITDNKNRALGELRAIIKKFGGKPASEGSVIWLFKRVGKITFPVKEAVALEEYELAAIECGAIDTARDTHEETRALIVFTKPEELDATQICLAQKGIVSEFAELTFVPKTSLSVEEQSGLAALNDALDEHNDVQEIFTNAKEK